jgi:hypothetical protein
MTDMLNSPSQAIIFRKLKGKAISFSSKVLDAVCEGWVADSSKGVEGISCLMQWFVYERLVKWQTVRFCRMNNS